MTSVLLATPTKTGLVSAPYMISMLQNVQVLSQKNIGMKFAIDAGKANIDMPRSMAATECLLSEHTHLMFIDDDLGFQPDLILKLIECDVDIVGVPYRRKQPEVSFTMRWFGELEQSTKNPALVRVHDIGTGLMLIKREVFEKLKPKVEWVNEYGHAQPIGMYFRHDVVDALPEEGEGKIYISEDLNFCRMARNANCQIWAYVDAPTIHNGATGYTGNYADVLEEILPGQKFRAPK